jgi:hypothetical protein
MSNHTASSDINVKDCVVEWMSIHTGQLQCTVTVLGERSGAASSGLGSAASEPEIGDVRAPGEPAVGRLPSNNAHTWRTPQLPPVPTR